MKKAVFLLLFPFFITNIMAQGTRVDLKLTTGNNGLLPGSSLYFKLTYLTGTSSEDYLIYRSGRLGAGFAPNTTYDTHVELPTTISDQDIKSFTIRQVSIPYDDWDLAGLKVSLVDRLGTRVWTTVIYSSDKYTTTHFSKLKKTLTVTLR
jgi:hypothetical protein